MRGFVIAALRLADLLGDVADVDDAVGVELRPIADRHQDVGAGFRLDRRSDARLDAVTVDGFDLELDAERLLGFVGDLAAQQLVGNRHEVDEFEPMQGRPLRVSRRPAGGQNARPSPPVPAATAPAPESCNKRRRLMCCISFPLIQGFTWILSARPYRNYKTHPSDAHVPRRFRLCYRCMTFSIPGDDPESLFWASGSFRIASSPCRPTVPP